jgi:5'-nucleotidase
MLYLLTNDDGIDAPGIRALELFARQLGDVIVVAPDGPRSGFSHRATVEGSMGLKQRDAEHYACAGTPVDCVRVAIAHLGIKPDWVLSGINRGANLGVDLYMSGTAGAAREAAIQGIPAFAFSHYHRTQSSIDWEQAAESCHQVFQQFCQRDLPPTAFWNVNLPDPQDLKEASHRTMEVPPDPSSLKLEYIAHAEAVEYKSHYHHRPRGKDTDVQHCLEGATTVSCVKLFS